jgi:exosortase B
VPLDAKPPSNAAARLEWLPVLAGLLVLYVPTFYDAATTFWQTDENGHGPIILAVIIWLIWQERAVLLTAPRHPAPVAGLVVLVPGLLIYVVGRAVGVALLEIGSLAPVLTGVLLAMRGWPALRALWFPIFFIAFMVPLPGIFVDAMTGPLKQYVSQIAAQILYAAGYPVARSGVILTIGQYQLLVADACSGINSMFGLSAVGLLYLYIVRRSSWLHNGLLIASLLPIAFCANVVRVMFLALITYHFGDRAGQGFLHGFSGMVLFIVALLVIFLLDNILARLIRPRAAT